MVAPEPESSPHVAEEKEKEVCTMDDRKTVTPTDSRQATPQRMNYRVLTRSLLIALVAAAVIYAYFYMQMPT